MPIALILIGALLAVAGIKNNAATLGATVKEDFSGAGSFWYWVFAVIIVGAVGYNSKAETVSRLFMTLIVLVFVLSNEGVYARVIEALQNPQPAAPSGGESGEVESDGGYNPLEEDGSFNPLNPKHGLNVLKELGIPSLTDPAGWLRHGWFGG